MTRTIRWTAWAILLALAVFQAYAQRFVISPDGVSYLDLSDAVVTGELRGLINLYWSPLYPLLIGVARLAVHATAETEIAVIHAVDVVCFAAMLAAFDYMLMSILSLASKVRHSALGGRWGAAGAYALFGCFALTMTPLELTTPDLLNAAAAFVAFGAMLRLRDDPARAMTHAVVLGTSLGLAALVKSFMVPWAVVCLVTLAVGVRRRRRRSIVVAAAAWLVFVLPWSFLLSTKAGHLTFGDAGRLTYAWYVNNQDAPSLGGVPPGARTARTEMILPGVGITPDTAYTDPMWADPATWNAALRPRLQLADQLRTLKVFHIFYVENLAPLLFLIFLVVVAPRGSRRVAWRRGWVIYIPALAGLVAYAMVVVTSRYVMAYVLGGTLVLLATVPVARRLVPFYALLGLAIPVVLEALLPQTIVGLALVASIIGGMLAASLVRSRRALGWAPAAVFGMAVTRVVLLPSFPSLVRVGAAGLTVLFWRVSLAALRRRRPVWLAHRAASALAFLLVFVFVFRLGIRLNQDRDALRVAANPRWGNVSWKIATELASHGITPGTRIALIGPHAESYWARTARLHIVANVPSNRISAFWQLPKPSQDSLLAEFARAGATVAIATLEVSGQPTDSSWTTIRYHGKIKTLVP